MDEKLQHMTYVMGIESSKYLNENKLPSVPSPKSGDFCEILVTFIKERLGSILMM
ncbi:TPA: hypothetical protein U1Y65_000191 [Streptococcus suis]|nr:hypothetical protein [Streptococcus suis]